MLKNIKKKLRSDRGDGSLVSMIIVLPLLLGILFTIIDFSAYFSNRALVQTIAHNGARTVAIMGGDGTATTGTSLEAKYGLNRATVCGQVDTTKKPFIGLNKTYSSAIECNIMVALGSTEGFINTTFQDVKCNPSSTSAIGERTTCVIKWSYGGTPGSTLSMIPLNSKGEHFGQVNVTAGSSESEVDLGGALVSRG